MQKKSKQFGEMLTEAMQRIHIYEQKPLAVVQDEVGFAVGKAGAQTIYYWRRGNIPETAIVETLAKIIATRSDLGKSWLRSFLASADYPYATQFCDQLFPQEQSGLSVDQINTNDLSQSIGKPFRTFVGREDKLQKLSVALNDPTAKRIIGIDGMGGIGKSALAYELADLCRRRGFFRYVVWINGRHDLQVGVSEVTIEKVCDAIAQGTGVTQNDQATGDERIARISSLLRQQPILLVLDNLDTATQDQEQLLEKLKPLLGIGKLIATSRHRFTGDLIPVRLTGFTPNTGRYFLRQEAEDRSIEEIGTASDQELNDIIRSTGGSPLAMKLVVGQLALLPLTQVLANLQRATLLRQGGGDSTYADLFYSIYMHSWEQLPQSTRDLLIWLAIFAQPTGGNFAALRSISRWTDVELNTHLHQLWQVSFLETSLMPAIGLQGKRYFLHALTHHFIKSDLVKESLSTQNYYTHIQGEGIRRYVEYFLSYLIHNEREYAQLDSEVENLLEALRLAEHHADPMRFIQATQHLVNYLIVRGNYTQAQQFLESAKQICVKIGLLTELSTILSLQGKILLKQGLLEEAGHVLRNTLAQVNGLQEADLSCEVLQLIGELEIKLGNYAVANANLQQALTYAQKQGYGRRLAQVLHLLGWNACFASQFPQAEQFLNQGFAVAQKLEDNELTIPILIHLTALSGMQAQYDKAETFAHETFKLAESINHREWTAGALKDLSSALIAQGKIEDGIKYAKQGVEIAQAIGLTGLESGLLNNLGVAVSNLGYLEKDPQKVEQGLQYYLKGLHIIRKQGNQERIRGLLSNIAVILTHLGRYHQAEVYLQEAESIALTLESEWAIADTKIALGNLCVAQEKYDLATQAFQTALETARQAAMPEMEADTLWGLAKVAAGQKNYQEARRLGASSLQIMEKIGWSSDTIALREWLEGLPLT